MISNSNTIEMGAVQEILDMIRAGHVRTPQELWRAKKDVASRLGERIPRNSEILAAASEEERRQIRELLRLKPVRSVSGVSIITVMPKPLPCPKSEPCVYCPGGPQQNTPQSYTGREPAAARALQCGYDPRRQVLARIRQLREIGHEVDKVELIIFGGTLTAYPRDYMEWFVVECLNALSGANASTIEEAQKAAERAPIRVSDMVLETRPDCCREEHVDFMLELGATRVELGVQTVYDDVYRKVNREHSVKDVVEATRIARDAGFAIVYHLMPNLPGSSYERDLEMFRQIFEDERFRPDAIKIYPTLVMPGTKLYEWWKRGEYEPYPFERLLQLIEEIKRMTPPWVRIQRIQRDIPLNLVAHGVERGDIRSLVQKRMRARGERCRCIRCREVGHAMRTRAAAPAEENVCLVRREYEASEGIEIFLSFEDPVEDVLIGLLRLRIPSENAWRPEMKNAAAVRELHVYGPLVPVGERASDAWQHKGYGRKLIAEAERIAREEYDLRRVGVLSGIGVREYYRRWGYRREGPYMVKDLKN